VFNIPELTFIPADYANDSLSGLQILSVQNKKSPNNDQKVVIKESFFLLWIPKNQEIDLLKRNIAQSFSSIPLDKVIFCNINLPEFTNEQNNYNETGLGNSNASSSSEIIQRVHLTTIMGIMIPLSQSIDLLLNIPISQNNNQISILPNFGISISAYFWSLSQKLAFQLISEGNFIPIMKRGSFDLTNGSSNSTQQNNADFIDCLTTKWKPVLRTENDFQNYSKILKLSQYSKIAYFIPDIKKIKKMQSSDQEPIDLVFKHPQDVITEYLNDLTDYLVRISQKKAKYEAFSSTYGFMVEDFDKIGKSLSWDARFLASLIHRSPYFKIYQSSELAVPDIINKWTMIADRSYWTTGFYLKIKLEFPKDQKSNWVIKFLLKSFDDDVFELDLGNFWKILHVSEVSGASGASCASIASGASPGGAGALFTKRWEIHRSLLEGFYILGLLFEPFKRLLNVKEPSICEINTNEATEFLERASSEIESNGITVELPSQFVETGDQRLRLVMQIGNDLDTINAQSSESSEEVIPSVASIRNVEFDMNSILTYKWDVEIGDHALNDEELKKITQSNDRLVFWDNKWILLNRNELEQYKKMLGNNQRTGQLKASEAMNLALSGSNSTETLSLTHALAKFNIKSHGIFKDIINVLKGQTSLEKIKQPDNFVGTLRPYQEAGFNWLLQITGLGFGACLADDMGLGKTIQVIAYLIQKKNDYIKRSQTEPKIEANPCNLIVCPTSVLSNWKREFVKFAPDYQVGLLYGPQRPATIQTLVEYLSHYDVVLLSYTILRRDIQLLSLIKWNTAILDESQNIKNYQSQQSQAAYRLQAKSRIVMTGTPIENRLIELWSQYHFINSFLLGEKPKFLQKYRIPIERLNNKVVAEALRKNITPFIIRRLKSDKNIISDLPEKQEIKLYTQLSVIQKKYYAETVEMGLKEIGDLEGMEGQKSTFKRSGLILTMILKLKQICNHPIQFAHEEIDKISNEVLLQRVSESGKLIRLLEMLEEIKENHNKILIFTQFTEMGSLLERIIEFHLQTKVLYLHGGVPQKKRDELVSSFQQDEINQYPFFILSLKAGGTGLNLTAASFVMHFDRWWNPSVENQATDRAFRIGQKKNVMVYKMICSGTIEEKIDQMIENKKELAESIITTSSEDWITNLSTSDLKQLFRLEDDMVEVDGEK
jgi:SNF2 family DNA or RNA helicase